METDKLSEVWIMRIGIITFHRSINYGAVTQCYALASEIKKRLPDAVVEVIDYVPHFRKEKYVPSLKNYLFGSVNPNKGIQVNLKIVISQMINLVTHPNNLRLLKKRYNAFEKSMAILPLSNSVYEDDVEIFRQRIGGKYDVIVVGSDCVWEWTTVPLPNAYYLCGDFGCKKMSFAASVGTDSFIQLNEEKKSILKESIADFDYIGVRDTSSEYVIKQLEIPDVQYFHNCDPTTFLDISLLKDYRQKVEYKIHQLKIPKDKMLIAVMGSDKYGKIARNIFGDSAVYVALYVPNKYCDYELLDLPVLEWAACFSLFDMTFTTFFHGTMLSLVNHTPVFSFDYLPERDNQISKLRELYSRLPLKGFYHRLDGEITAEQLENLRKIAYGFVTNPPTEKIANALAQEAKYSESFFECLLRIHNEVINPDDEARV